VSPVKISSFKKYICCYLISRELQIDRDIKVAYSISTFCYIDLTTRAYYSSAAKMAFFPITNQTSSSANSTTTSNDPFVYDKVFNKPAFISIYVFIFVPSVVCNGLVCWIVKKNTSMHTNTNFLLVNLAVADMLATVLSIFHVVDYLAIDLHLGMYSKINCIDLEVALFCI
jgi:hypothetical protein